jgi:hypothetical protein
MNQYHMDKTKNASDKMEKKIKELQVQEAMKKLRDAPHFSV